MMCCKAYIVTKCLLAAILLGAPASSPGSIIGTNTPAVPVTSERIARLPATQRKAWSSYLKRSERQMKADRAFFERELKDNHVVQPAVPPHSRGVSSIPLREPSSWYGGAEALRIADIIVSFQTLAGGWSKNLDMTQHRRAPGEHFAGDNISAFPVPLDNDTPRDPHWNYVGTFDNGATTTQLRFLAKVIAAAGNASTKPYLATFLKGIDYTLAAQFPNGGWPQVWPLQGGYHDSITYNDGAMINVLKLLDEVARGHDEFEFCPPKTRKAAEAAVQRGIRCILDSQIVVAGRQTVWCQQHDALTLEPASARNYEMPSLCGSESADILIFLMGIPYPDSRTVKAVPCAADWFQRSAVRDVAFKPVADQGRELVPESGASPLWARYYGLDTDRPIFGDRDKTIHDDLSEISNERRNGYMWFTTAPQVALDQYAIWRQSHPLNVK